MALEAKLVQKLSQSLLMTPQLQQAIKLLQLGRLEYIDAIQQELMENPILEELRIDEGERDTNDREANFKERDKAKPEQEGAKGDDSPVDWERYLENLSDYRGASTPKNFVDSEDRPSLEATLTKELSLREHLFDQIRMSDLSGEQSLIAVEIVGNLNQKGYLCCSYEEIAQELQCTSEEVTQVIEFFKNADPVGVAARDLRECLLFQLESAGLSDSLAYRIVNNHLALVEKRKFQQITKEEQCTMGCVSKAMKIIQSLEPHPARQFPDEATRYIVPDIYVTKVGDEWVISLNEDGLPRLRVSPYYLDLLKKTGEESEPSRNYLHEKLKSASWFIKSIHQRQQTIFKVTESIVKFQGDFFEHGISRLKPLVLKEVADDIEMHESTVSRVTTNKYVHTPQGVYELKFFFSTGIKTAGGDLSSSAIKERIRQIISEEDPKSPISDQQIVDMLTAEKTKIARRTVAKYRENLGIPSSSKRKNLFD